MKQIITPHLNYLFFFSIFYNEILNHTYVYPFNFKRFGHDLTDLKVLNKSGLFDKTL